MIKDLFKFLKCIIGHRNHWGRFHGQAADWDFCRLCGMTHNMRFHPSKEVLTEDPQTDGLGYE